MISRRQTLKAFGLGIAVAALAPVQSIAKAIRTVDTSRLTLLQHARDMEDSMLFGRKTNDVVSLLTQSNEILADMTFIESTNEPPAIKTGLPNTYWSSDDTARIV